MSPGGRPEDATLLILNLQPLSRPGTASPGGFGTGRIAWVLP